MHVLFICRDRKHHSLTAEELYRESYETMSAGLESPEHPVTEEMIEWADIVLVAHEKHKQELARRFPHHQHKPVISLDIPEEYTYMQPQLVEHIHRRMEALRDAGFI